MDKIAIVARERFCARILEFLQNTTQGKIEYTHTTNFDSNSIAVFIFESVPAEVVNAQIWIHGEFNSFDVIALPFANTDVLKVIAQK